jgi:hypothetical protein
VISVGKAKERQTDENLADNSGEINAMCGSDRFEGG